MPNFVKTGKQLQWYGELCDVQRGTYCNGDAPALLLTDVKTGMDYDVLSVNLPKPPPVGCVWIKDWSENEGAFAALIAAGIIEDTGLREPTGWVEAKCGRLLL